MSKTNDYAELSALESIESPTDAQKEHIHFLTIVIEDREWERRQIAAEDREWFGE